MTVNRRLQIAADLDNLKQIRAFIEETTQIAGLEHEQGSEVVLAVDEAVTNIMTHGCLEGGCAIELEVQADAHALVVRIRDNGPLFDPTALHDPDLHVPPLEREAPGGFGVYLFKHLVNQTRYRTTPEGLNELTLLKRLD